MSYYTISISPFDYHRVPASHSHKYQAIAYRTISGACTYIAQQYSTVPVSPLPTSTTKTRFQFSFSGRITSPMKLDDIALYNVFLITGE
jgi:hypothetical protein